MLTTAPIIDHDCKEEERSATTQGEAVKATEKETARQSHSDLEAYDYPKGTIVSANARDTCQEQ